MMKHYWNILIAFLLLTSSLSGQTALERFQAANLSYEEKNFEEAIEQYNQLLQEGYISDDLHYNLGNAYFRTNEIAPAILHYEKALKVNPSNEDAAHNLKYANSRTIDKIETPPELFFYRWWKAITHSFSLASWTSFIILFILFGIGGLAIYFFFKDSKIRKLSFYSGIVAFALAIISWMISESHFQSLNKEEFAIIMSPTVDISSSPSEGSSRLFVLHEGSKVSIRDKSGEWYEIRLPNGNGGWIKASELEVI